MRLRMGCESARGTCGAAASACFGSALVSSGSRIGGGCAMAVGSGLLAISTGSCRTRQPRQFGAWTRDFGERTSGSSERRGSRPRNAVADIVTGAARSFSLHQ